jgi:hypothetical protein
MISTSKTLIMVSGNLNTNPLFLTLLSFIFYRLFYYRSSTEAEKISLLTSKGAAVGTNKLILK